MNINIKATGIELTPALKEFITDKVGSIGRFVRGEGAEAFVEVARTTNHHKKGDVFSAEIQIAVPGEEGILAKAEEWDVHRAINKAKDEVKGRLTSSKEKRQTKFFDTAKAWKRISRIDPLARFWGEK